MGIQITIISPETVDSYLPDLSDVMHACVHAGANIGFVLPFDEDDSLAFWNDEVRPMVEQGTRILIVAINEGGIRGSVQLDINSPPNQLHRADVTKLIVHPDYRRQGIARALLRELETQATSHGRTLLTMDTRTGDSAEPLYLSMGYHIVGQIPDFCMDPIEDKLYPTTVMYKKLT